MAEMDRSLIEVLLADPDSTPNVVAKILDDQKAAIVHIADVLEDKNQKGQPDGYAPLDSSGQVPLANLPPIFSGATIQEKESFTLDSFDIANKYIDLVHEAADVLLTVKGGCAQFYGFDYTIISDGSLDRRLSWDSLGLEPLLEAGDQIEVFYKRL